MELTNEEKKKIADSATYLMQAFCELKLAEDRIQIMNNLSASLLKIGIDKESQGAALGQYVEKFMAARVDFFNILGIGEDNKEFWEYNAKVEEENNKKEKKEAK